MTRRERLQEQYEDALFALLMDDLAVEQGKRAYEENEKLKKDSQFEIPIESQKRCLQTISRCCTKKHLRTFSHQFYGAFSKVAVIAMVAIMLVTTALAVSPTLRSGAMNLLIETFQNRTEFRLVRDSSPEISSENGLNFTANWLPSGYKLEKHSEDKFSSQSIYSSHTGQKITIELLKGENMGLSLDTEDATVSHVMINEKDTILVSKDEVLQLCLAREDLGIYLHIIGNAGQQDDIIKIAEHIEIK